MAITITVYNSTYSQVIERVGSFNNERDATSFRDNSSLANQHTRLEQLGKHDEYTPAEMFDGGNASVQASEAVDYSHAEANGWVATIEGWLFKG